MTDDVYNARLSAIAESLSQDRLPPVEQWQPERASGIDIRIARDGSWFYRGTRIERQRMVRLFSTVLRAQEDGSVWLVTPQEKLRIVVEVAPFTAVLMDNTGTALKPTLEFTTNVGDRVRAGPEHPITVSYDAPDGQPTPLLLVRGRLQALISRAVFIELGTLACERDGALGVVSDGVFMPMSDPADSVVST